MDQAPDISRLPVQGRIDLHCHLIPGVDDGCETLDDAIQTVRLLKEAGYVASVVTPHVLPELFPENTPAHIRQWTAALQKVVDDAGLDYPLWPGGEVRLDTGLIGWFQAHGVPTLGPSRYVLTDFWLPNWSQEIFDTLAWLQREGYRPILAHPERLPDEDDVEENINRLEEMGVIFQGNLRCLTGEDGLHADRRVRSMLEARRYKLMCTDVHSPTDLAGRLDGLGFVEQEFGSQVLEKLTSTAPRRLLAGEII